MKTKNILLLLVLLLVACDKGTSDSESVGTPASDDTAVVADPSTPNTPSTPMTTPTMTSEFMELINDHRVSLGLNALIMDEDMNAIVQTHSDAMASGAIAFGHGGFSARCSSARSAIGGGNLCGENVASGQKTVQAVFTSWMNSSGHRANIEQARYTHCGFAFKKSSAGTIYWTHLFLEHN